MLQYCPVCFNTTLDINPRGMIQLAVNNRKMDACRVMFDMNRMRDFESDLEKKLDDYFKWYSSFKNREPVCKLEIYTCDFGCDNRCPVPLNTKFSIIDILIPAKKIEEFLVKVREKYKLEIILKENKEFDDD